MFCPACGRENSTGRKFCASCGINLEAVSQALTRGTDDFLTKIDLGFDQFLARYSERVFKGSPPVGLERSVGKSWKLLGKSVVTSFFDLLLFFFMWNVIPLRFLILLVSTPFRKLSERGKYQRDPAPEIDGRRTAELADARPPEWLQGTVASVTEHTTVILADPPNRGVKTSPGKDRGA